MSARKGGAAEPSALVKRALMVAGDIGSHMRFDEAARRVAEVRAEELKDLEGRAAAVRLELESLGREQVRERIRIAGLMDELERVALELKGTPEWSVIGRVIVGDIHLSGLATFPKLDQAALADTRDEALSVTLYGID
jgi:hypothetical protein